MEPADRALPSTPDQGEITGRKIPATEDLRMGLKILTGFSFKQEGPFPEQSVPVYFFTESPVASTMEEAEQVREQKIPASLRDPKKGIVGITTFRENNLPGFTIRGDDDFKQLWEKMEPLLKETEEGKMFLRRLDTVDKLNSGLNEIISYLQKLDDDRYKREGGSKNMPRILPVWSASEDGSFYWINVSDQYVSYVVQYLLNDWAKKITPELKDPVKVKTILRGGINDPIVSLTGINIPGNSWPTSSPGINHLIVAAELAQSQNFQQALVSPDIKGLMGDALCDTHIFYSAIDKAYDRKPPHGEYGRKSANTYSPLVIEIALPELVKNLPQRLADAFNEILTISDPQTNEKAKVVWHSVMYGTSEQKTLVIELPYKAVVNSDVLATVSDNRAFQGLLKMATTTSSSLPENMEQILVDAKGKPNVSPSWQLNADVKQNICQFELPVHDIEAAKKVIQILKDIMEGRIDEMHPTSRSYMERLLVAEPVRIEDNKIIFPATVAESFLFSIQRSKNNGRLKEAIAKATQNRA